MSTSPSDAPSMAPPGTDAPGGDSAAPGALGRDALVVLGSYVLLGVVGAFLWWLLVDPALFTKGLNGGLGMDEVQLGKRFNDDGWYAVIAGVLGLLAGAFLTWSRSRDPLLTAGLILVGSGLAAVVMALLGGALGPPDPSTVVDATAVGGTVPTPLEVTGLVGYLVWPITSLIGALVVLWAPDPEGSRSPT